MSEPEKPATDEAVKAEGMPADRLKYLEMIQGVVNRMATSSSTLKGWTVTLVAALVALAAKDGVIGYLWVAVLPTLIFAGLDAYYLQVERGYRKLFDRAAKMEAGLPLFCLHRDVADRGFRAWVATLFRPVVWGYYLAVLGSIFIALAVCHFHGKQSQEVQPIPLAQ